jgi:hypothetical protein
MNGERVDMAAFQQRHALPADASRPRDLDLTPPAALSPQTNENADPDIVLGHRRNRPGANGPGDNNSSHAPSMGRHAKPPLTRGLD